MSFREIINGSFEPLWRKNAREDANKHRSSLFKSEANRRAFIKGIGVGAVGLAGEYLEQRRAVAFPFKRGSVTAPIPAVTGITNARTGTTYQYLQNAAYEMATGDTLLLPAGDTYKYQGQTYYYCDWHNWNGQRFGSNAYGTWYLGNKNDSLARAQGALFGVADYGTFQGVGTANNGRARLSVPWAVLAQDFHPLTDTEMFFDPAVTPVSTVFADPVFTGAHISWSVNNGQWGSYYISRTGINAGNNSFTGVSMLAPGNIPISDPSTIPAGTIVHMAGIYNLKALFVVCGDAAHGYTFTNLEMMNVATNDSSQPLHAIRQTTCDPNTAQYGSVTLNNCYNHDCNSGMSLAGSNGLLDDPAFFRMFDTELANNGTYTGQTHNLYVGHVGEFLADNCYTHKNRSGWLFKSRAALNIITYSQIRGEMFASMGDFADFNTASGCDFPNGGLVYMIGCINQANRFTSNVQINFDAEDGAYASCDLGASHPLSELYLVNNNLIGPDNGVGYHGLYGVCPTQAYNIFVKRPPMPKLSSTAGGSLPSRGYWTQATACDPSGTGESPASTFWGQCGSFGIFTHSIWNRLNVGANNLLKVTSIPQITGGTRYNVYANYIDPRMYIDPDNVRVWWDPARTLPVYNFVAGGDVISVTGTLANGTNQITGVSGLANISTLQNLTSMTVFVSGVSTGLFVSAVSGTTLTLSANYTGTTVTAGTLTFGWHFMMGVTHVTALGDSAAHFYEPSEPLVGTGLYADYYYDGAWNQQTDFGYLYASVTVPPGQKLVVNAPPIAAQPSWATGVNFWVVANANEYDYFNYGGYRDPPRTGARSTLLGYSLLNPTPISFGGSYTTPANIWTRGQKMRRDMFLQNASPINIGTDWTEPTSGLINNINPNRTKLQWRRRCFMNVGSGATVECWYAVVPVGGLNNYTENFTVGYWTGASAPRGCVTVWRGCAANPFDAIMHESATSNTNSISVSTRTGNLTILAAIHTFSGGIPSGYTSLSNVFGFNTSYKTSVSALSNTSIAESGGSNQDNMLVECLLGASAPPTLVGSAITYGAASVNQTFTIPSANAGDVVVILQDSTSVPIWDIGNISPWFSSTCTSPSPLVISKNNLIVNYQTTLTAVYGQTSTSLPNANLTTANNLWANRWNTGTSQFTAPLWATVFTNPDQTQMDYRLAVGSPALNAAADPGTDPHGYVSLVPNYQVSWNGIPSLGSPIPAKAARNDVGPGKTGAVGARSS